MEKQHRALDKNLVFLQNNLIDSEEFYGLLLQESIFTNQVIDAIRAKPTLAERATLLVDRLRRRDKTSFDLFLAILDRTKQTFVADRLREHVQSPSISPSATSTSLDDAKRQSATTVELLQAIIDQQYERISKQEAEYQELKDVLHQTQNDLEDTVNENRRLVDENEVLDDTIEQLRVINSKTDAGAAKEKRDLKERSMELERKIEIRQQQIDELEQEKESLEKEIAALKRELELECENRRKIALELGIDESASKQEVMKKLREMKQTNARNCRRAEELESQLTQATSSREQLEDKLRVMNKRTERLVFLMRQKELEVFKLCGRRRKAPVDVQVEVTPLPQRLFEFPKSRSTLTARHQPMPDIADARRIPRQSRTPRTSRRSTKYCVLCRQHFDPADDPICRIHHNTTRSANGETIGAYACCGDQTSWSAGCLRIRHLYAVYNEREDNFELSNGLLTIRQTFL